METASAFVLILLLELASSQEVATPSSQLAPRNFNHHAYEAKLKSLMGPVPTRKGPVLFPNDVPPIDSVPEIASSRPLYLSQTNTTYDQTGSANLPTFLAYSTKYKPMVFGTLPPDSGSTLSPTVGSVIDDYADNAPYTDIVKKSISPFNLENNYLAYQPSTPLPRIYNALSKQAEENLYQTQQNDPSFHYQPEKPIKQYSKIDTSNDGSISENAEDKSYAFSYTVKDQKTGDDFSHSQRSSGSATNGEYRVRLPDGRMQVVSYTADENGYKADVRYDVDSVSTVEYRADTVRQSPEQNTIYKYNPHQNSGNQYDTQQNLNNDYTDDRINDNVNKYYPGQNLINERYNQEQNQLSRYNTDQNDLLQRFNRDQPVDYISKEYDSSSGSRQYDYSSEYENRTPYKSKFAELFSSNADNGLHFSSTTSKPSYVELEEVLADALPNVRPTFYHLNPTERSTSGVLKNVGQYLYNYGDTEKQERSSLSDPLDSFAVTTPRSYLVSTIASLKDRASKPILSDSFISRINKYLSFK